MAIAASEARAVVALAGRVSRIMSGSMSPQQSKPESLDTRTSTARFVADGHRAVS
jgi:hypothetical protein